jgi:hypothetical protein
VKPVPKKLESPKPVVRAIKFVPEPLVELKKESKTEPRLREPFITELSRKSQSSDE